MPKCVIEQPVDIFASNVLYSATYSCDPRTQYACFIDADDIAATSETHYTRIEANLL